LKFWVWKLCSCSIKCRGNW